MGLYDEFEKRYSSGIFPANWVEVEVKTPQKTQPIKKDLETLQAELQLIEENITNISQKQLRLSNLAKLYEN